MNYLLGKIILLICIIVLSNKNIIQAFHINIISSEYNEVLSKHYYCNDKKICRNPRILFLAKNDVEDEFVDYGFEDEPLSKGIESVTWLPSVTGKRSVDIFVDDPEGAETLPLFPLGGIVYTPNTKHILNIFEPRYRQMYNDILMNGSKRFVVSMSHPEKSGTFAQMGVLFQLEDLREVSEQTNDQVKYICNHRVIGRVKIHSILNPSVWSTRETYLKVKGTILLDDDDPNTDEADSEKKTEKGGGLSEIYSSLMRKGSAVTPSESAEKEEKALSKSFAKLVQLQYDLQEDVRFTRASATALSVSAGSSGEDTLWNTIRLWQTYTEQRLAARQNELQREFQEKLLQFLTKEKGVKEEELPSAIGFEDLSPALQKEVQELQKRMAVDLQPLLLESTLAMQKVLEAKDHTERLNLLRFFVDAEFKRLEAKKTLQGMFVAGPSTNNLDDEDDEDDYKTSDSTITPLPFVKDEENNMDGDNGLLMDDPDAFQ